MIDLDRVEEVCYHLQGTCQSLEDVASLKETMDEEFCMAIDERIFCCDQCNWWCEMSEMSEFQEWICDGCQE